MPAEALRTLGRLGDPAAFDGHALYLWGEGLRAMGRCYEALMPLQRAARATPNDIHIRVALGWCYKRTGRLDLAIEMIEEALILRPETPLLRYNLACYLSLAAIPQGPALQEPSSVCSYTPQRYQDSPTAPSNYGIKFRGQASAPIEVLTPRLCNSSLCSSPPGAKLKH